MFFWKAYLGLIQSNLSSLVEQNPFNLNYWKDNLFITIIIYIFPLSLIALIPGLYLSAISNNYVIFSVDLFAFSSLFFILLSKKASLNTRKLLFTGSLYALSLVLLLYLGLMGPGLIYLFAICIFSLMIFSNDFAYYWGSINTLICIFISFILYFKLSPTASVNEQNFLAWIAISSNLIFLSYLASFLLPRLFNNLQTTIEGQQELKQDLLAKKEALQDTLVKLDRKNQDLELFNTIASHDLREPLRMVQSHLQLLQRRYIDQLDEKANNFILFAVDGAKRMNNLIVDILEYSKVGSDNQEKTCLDINLFLTDLIHFKVNKEIGINPQINLSPLPTLWANKTELTILFQNLIGNGLKYQLPGNKPILQIDCQEEENQYIFSIKDNGIGIDSENFDQIFQLFQRLHDKSSYSGTGVGLAICKKIVEGWGGKIWVESQKGQGSTFYFTIKKDQ